MTAREANSEKQRFDEARKKLKNELLAHMPTEGIKETKLPGVGMARRDHTGFSEHRFDMPVVSLLVQGSKKILVGERSFEMRTGDILAVGLDMPSSSTIIEATPDAPLLTIFFQINRQTVSELIHKLCLSSPNTDHTSGAEVTRADADFMEAALKLAQLLNRPEHMPFRTDLVLLDLHYLLLSGSLSRMLCEIYGNGKFGNQLFSTIKFLRKHLETGVTITELANVAHMSESTLYRHFKAVTGLSPLQYHKKLRLHEARRLIMADRERVSTAAFRTGYESVSQFIREYRKLFGESPGKSGR